jgi:tripartite-type tricarboxylate transporter receptor subunit TctC
LIEMARASPGKIAYGSAGFGNSTHIAGEMFQVMAGVKLIHVPYKGAGPAVNDLLGGQIPLMFGPSPVVVPMVQAGRLRPLAFTGLKRSSQLPDAPTVDEAGVKGYENSGWYGMYGPRGVPKAIVARLNAALVAIVKMPDTRERFAALNLEPVGSSPEQFAQFLKDDLEKYARIAKAAGIKPE